ncbi:LOW QUALITY PROTEIN: CDK5 regulatory subunit-associated protein 3 [Sarcoramphus papa]
MQVSPQDYQNVPIDIQTGKLLDWLVDRRHCNLKWQNQVLAIREKINAAIQDMPENEEIKQLLAGAYLHYFHCLRIVEILKGTEASTKNLFGRYSSQRMKDWQEIVSLYEKENTYLAELASLLVRSISYEIPSLRKQISRCQQAQQDFARREEECQLGAAELRERFFASCKQYGITGDNVRQELLALVKDLPSLLSEIAAGASALSEAIELYQACVEFVCESSAELVVPLLRHVGKRGNTTVYEWRTGLQPLRVERPEVEEVPEQPKEDTLRSAAESRRGGSLPAAPSGGPARAPLPLPLALSPTSPMAVPVPSGPGALACPGEEAVPKVSSGCPSAPRDECITRGNSFVQGGSAGPRPPQSRLGGFLGSDPGRTGGSACSHPAVWQHPRV